MMAAGTNVGLKQVQDINESDAERIGYAMSTIKSGRRVSAATAFLKPVLRRPNLTVLTNTTLGVFMAVLDSSIVMISLPDIFRGINLNPLAPENFAYLLWILMGYGLVSAALVVTAGRVGDMYGRVRMFKIGFVIFTAAAVGLSLRLSSPDAVTRLYVRVTPVHRAPATSEEYGIHLV